MLLLRVTPQQAVWCPHNRHHLLFHFLWYKGWHSTTRCLKVKHYSLFQSISEMSLVVKFCSYWIVFCWISKTRNIYSSLLNQYKVIQPRLAVEHAQFHTGEPLSGRHTHLLPSSELFVYQVKLHLFPNQLFSLVNKENHYNLKLYSQQNMTAKRKSWSPQEKKPE